MTVLVLTTGRVAPLVVAAGTRGLVGGGDMAVGEATTDAAPFMLVVRTGRCRIVLSSTGPLVVGVCATSSDRPVMLRAEASIAPGVDHEPDPDLLPPSARGGTAGCCCCGCGCSGGGGGGEVVVSFSFSFELDPSPPPRNRLAIPFILVYIAEKNKNEG